MINNNIYAVILAGGTGTRFWPLSRSLEPKQFLKLYNNESLLQQTIKRILPLVPVGNIFFVANPLHKFELEQQIAVFGVPSVNIIYEPEGKNTAPAIALAASDIIRKDPDSIMVVLPSDHSINDNARFNQILNKAILTAEKGFLVTLGITPGGPATGYGYIQKGEKLQGQVSAFRVARFKEKPDIAQAKKYLKTKKYFWNSGMFIWKNAVILDAVKKFLPKVYACVNLHNKPAVFEKKWKELKSISIDYGVLERSSHAAVVITGNIGWSDLGTWSSLDTIHTKNKNSNIIQANCIDLKSKNISVYGNNKLITTIGLNNLIVVDTADATLICNKDCSEDVKGIVELVKQSGGYEHYSHNAVKRPWGNYLVISKGQGFKVKVIEVLPHKRLSLQRHKFRSEHWVVVEGTAKVTCGSEVRLVNSNESIFVSASRLHRLENPKDKVLKIVEVQSGSYLEEDDIERFDDDYKRG